MKIIAYIAHPIGGDVQGNLNKLSAVIRHVNLHEPNVIPFAPYVSDLYALNDDNPKERAIGMSNDAEFFKRAVMDEVWLYGDKISKGMHAEIKKAQKANIPVVPKTEATKREYEMQYGVKG